MDVFFINSSRAAQLRPTSSGRDRLLISDSLRTAVATAAVFRVAPRYARKELYVESFVQSLPQRILLVNLLRNVASVAPKGFGIPVLALGFGFGESWLIDRVPLVVGTQQ